MADAGMEIVTHVRDMSFLGFLEIVRHLPFIRRVFRRLVSLLGERKPDAVVLIDYPGFNLRFARTAKKRKIPVIYYIGPQVWAWGRGRIKRIARSVDRMIVIFPFEEDFYRTKGMDVHFVGHPLKDVVRVSSDKEDFFKHLDLIPGHPTIGLLPGSREQEVDRLLPEMVGAFDLLKQWIPGIQAILGKAPTLGEAAYASGLEGTNIRAIRDQAYEVMAHTDVVLVASGTATLETAIIGTPMIILYKMSRLSFLIGRMLVRLKCIGLVNIVYGGNLVLELLQDDVRAERIAEETRALLEDDRLRARMKAGLKSVSQKLGGGGASRRAAESVIDFLDRVRSS